LLSVLDEVNHGLFLVNEAGEVRYANRIAARDCVAGQPLHYDGQRLHVEVQRDQRELQQALAAAQRGRRSMLNIRCVRASVCVGVVPVGTDSDIGDIVALLVLGKQVVCEPLNLQFFAQMYRLTHAESSVLSSLCEGLRPSQVAGRGCVALSTVRTQIDSIRQKTGAQSANDVVRMVQMLPPIACMVSSGTTARGQEPIRLVN
jgi:DNA-binding CsgD family transcriptional regulator